jgi:hypothetical protein
MTAQTSCQGTTFSISERNFSRRVGFLWIPKVPVVKVSGRMRIIPFDWRYFTITSCIYGLNQSCLSQDTKGWGLMKNRNPPLLLTKGSFVNGLVAISMVGSSFVVTML